MSSRKVRVQGRQYRRSTGKLAAMRRESCLRLLTAGRRFPDSSDFVDSTDFAVAVFTAGKAGCDINEMANTAAANIRGTVYLDFINRIATCTAGGAVHLTICNSGVRDYLIL